MAGGLGQRLRPLTLSRPKPLVPLFGRPLLAYIIGHLYERGVDEVWVTAGHLGRQIEAFLETLPTDVRLRCRVEQRPRGTAGAVADLCRHLDSPFLVVSGDAVIDLDLAALREAHTEDGNLATLCLAPAGERLRFGTVALAGRRVERFVEKPPLGELAPGASLNTGCYLLDVEALREVPADDPFDFALDVFPRLLARGAPLGAVPAAGYWRDIGTLEAYREAHFDGLAGRLPWRLPPGAESPEGPVHVGTGASVHPRAQIRGPAVLGERCRVGPGALVERCVLLDGARVGAGASLRECVVEAGAVVPRGVTLAAAGIAGRPPVGRRPVGRTLRPLAGAREDPQPTPS
jgi:mannose-1-phosphate guanylyltransferase/phosphomannomutase